MNSENVFMNQEKGQSTVEMADGEGAVGEAEPHAAVPVGAHTANAAVISSLQYYYFNSGMVLF